MGNMSLDREGFTIAQVEYVAFHKIIALTNQHLGILFCKIASAISSSDVLDNTFPFMASLNAVRAGVTMESRALKRFRS